MPTNSNPLRRVLESEGPTACQHAFWRIYRQNPQKALSLPDDSESGFPCLYALREILHRPALRAALTPRCRMALRVIQQVTRPEVPGPDLLREAQTPVGLTLRWMLRSGLDFPHSDADYDRVLDTVVNVLVRIYEAYDEISAVTDLLFRRKAADRNTHDLEFALFRTRRREALEEIAKRLTSENDREAQYARELLRLDEIMGPEERDPERCRARFVQWMDLNDPYLYFTGETRQYSAEPKPVAVDLSRKYLNLPFGGYERPPDPDPAEHPRLQVFLRLSEYERAALADYSLALRVRDEAAWRVWMESDPKAQIRAVFSERRDSV